MIIAMTQVLHHPVHTMHTYYVPVIHTIEIIIIIMYESTPDGQWQTRCVSTRTSASIAHAAAPSSTFTELVRGWETCYNFIGNEIRKLILIKRRNMCACVRARVIRLFPTAEQTVIVVQPILIFFFFLFIYFISFFIYSKKNPSVSFAAFVIVANWPFTPRTHLQPALCIVSPVYTRARARFTLKSYLWYDIILLY